MTAATAQRKTDARKEAREEAFEEWVKEETAARSFDDLSDAEAREQVQKEEL